MAMLLGKKIGMTQIFDPTGKIFPVTVIQAGPCPVLQVKTLDIDGYNAVQMGFGEIKKSRVINPVEGHAKKASVSPKRFVREMRLSNEEKSAYKPGDAITVSIFEEKSFVDVVGVSKGKGFQGTMKRYKFAGQPNSHGTERKHRSPGSIAGYGTDRGHGGDIKKGKRMSGHMGHTNITSKNHRVISVDTENNLLAITGSVPGAEGAFVVVKSAKRG